MYNFTILEAFCEGLSLFSSNIRTIGNPIHSIILLCNKFESAFLPKSLLLL